MLDDKTVLITGGASGIGAATAAHIASLGARVAVVDLDDEAGQGVVDAIRSSGGTASYFRADVGSEDEVEAMVAAVIDTFGSLDGAFNNAGIEQANVLLHELTAAQWDRAIRVDLTGVFTCIKFEVRAMLERGGGSIVNTSSALGRVAVPLASEYIAAKHGVIGLTLAAAAEYGTRGIRVNAVLPGAIETPMVARAVQDPAFAEHFTAIRARHLLGRLGAPSEIGEAVAWLLSPHASFVTGTAMSVDGGYLAN
ncbi:SDR family NAD(P)-dependent oxidoreductase [Microbacterium sp. RD1]|uniref:SDR family NAD(P)-dependent oxidoreductase n=1 Tax=Microbacterium sp. RD1 TaxID=3457313 RepID=UPI003FA5C856